MAIYPAPAFNNRAANYLKYLKYVFIILALAIIARTNIFVYSWAGEKGKKDGWDEITVNTKQVPKGNFITETQILYELEGVLAEKKDQSIVLKKGNATREFNTQGSFFYTLSPYVSFDQWPSKIISNDPSVFQTGDLVTVVLTDNFKEGLRIEPSYVWKIQDE